MKNFIFYVLSAILLLACVRDEELQEPQESTDEPQPEYAYTEEVVAVAPDFEEITKTSISSTGTFAWAEGDVIGVVPMDESTFQTNYEVKTIGSNPKTAVFDGGAWKLKVGKEYAAYYPCVETVLTSDGVVELSSLGQRQSGNDNRSHFGNYDFMYAGAVSSVNGSTTFAFKHKVGLLKIMLPVKATATYTDLTLQTDERLFVSKAEMSLVNGTVTPTSKSDRLSLQLDGIALSKGDDLVAWMSVLPTAEIAGHPISIVLTTENGETLTYDNVSSVNEFAAGKLYKIEGQREEKVIFSDDFSWLSPFIADGCADFVNGTYTDLETRITYCNNNSINLHKTYPDTFPSALAAAGYSDKVPSNQTIYGQGTRQNPYLKFCKGNTQTALVMQPFSGSYDQAFISFDWAIHMTMSALDVVDLQLRIEGDGTFSNGSKESDILSSGQTEVATPFWTKANVQLFGVNSSTRISISSKTAFDGNFLASGQHRFYIDNIVVSAEPGFDVDPVAPTPGSTVYGLVNCGGKGVRGVVVSDGYEVTSTDENGVYQLNSAKKTGYVFISIPSGYEVARNGVLPLFHKNLVKSASTQERVDFELFDAGDQTNHTMLYFGDIHLANRTNDRNQFRIFTNEIATYLKEHPSDKIYALTLGDMTWDLYWYTRSYVFDKYLAEYNGVIDGLSIFHTIGNHDHDMNATGDWNTVLRFRNDVCPNYYSFNIGKIHYVVLDNIECTNATASTTDGNVRKYNKKVVSEVMDWLKKDLSYVSKSTPVVATMHASVFDRNGDDSMTNSSALVSAFSGYNVTFVSGHTHRLYTVDKSSSVREHNNGAICAAWWWAGKYNQDYNISTDGSPSGYRVMSVQGTTQKSYFKAVGRPATYQFRAYDRNKVNFDVSMVPESAQSEFRSELLKSVLYGNYLGGSSSNDVIINVWDWNKNWKIEVTENGKALSVSQKTLMDPSFYIAYTIPHMKAGNNSISWHAEATNNMFVVSAASATSTLKIKVTDDEGRVYTEEMKRPREHTIESYTK